MLKSRYPCPAKACLLSVTFSLIVCCISRSPSVPEPVLLISNRYYIRNITLTGTAVHLLAMNLTNAVALDFDWQGRHIYWSDVTSSASKIMRMSVDGGPPTVSGLCLSFRGPRVTMYPPTGPSIYHVPTHRAFHLPRTHS